MSTPQRGQVEPESNAVQGPHKRFVREGPQEAHSDAGERGWAAQGAHALERLPMEQAYGFSNSELERIFSSF